MKNFRLFQTERVCKDNFEFDEKWQRARLKSKKLCGEKKQFVLFPQCFQKTCTAGT